MTSAVGALGRRTYWHQWVSWPGSVVKLRVNAPAPGLEGSAPGPPSGVGVGAMALGEDEEHPPRASANIRANEPFMRPPGASGKGREPGPARAQRGRDAAVTG